MISQIIGLFQGSQTIQNHPMNMLPWYSRYKRVLSISYRITAAYAECTAAYTCSTAAYIVICDFTGNAKSNFDFD